MIKIRNGRLFINPKIVTASFPSSISEETDSSEYLWVMIILTEEGLGEVGFTPCTLVQSCTDSLYLLYLKDGRGYEPATG